MKKYLVLLVTLMLSMTSYAQQEGEKQTKFESFASKTGVIRKFVDYNTPNLASMYNRFETSVRIVIGENENKYYYRIEKPETSSSSSRIAMIEYSDLVEINKALEKILSEVDSDIAANPDYLENRFITEDDVRVGYYISKGKATWFLRLTDYNNSTAYFKEHTVLVQNLKDAQAKIEELKAAGK